MKRTLVIILSLSLLLSALAMPVVKLYAETSSSIEAQSMQRLMDLGIFSKTAPDKMDLNRTITREELATVLVQVNGQQDKLDIYKNSSLFSDVPSNRWSNASIQVAVKLGYMTALPDGKFHPTDKVTFALAATVFGKLLKYDDANLSGSYPQNYLTQIDNLGILDEITYTTTGTVTRGQMAVMLDRLFTTRVFGTNSTFVETVSNYQTVIILENSVLNPDSDERRLLTDKGIFYLKKGISLPEAGKKYLLRLNNKEIQYASQSALKYEELSVRSISGGKITTNEGEKVSVPAGIPIYYQGSETDYDKVSASIQANSSIIISYDENDAVYGALFDPQFSKPEVMTASKVGVPLEIKYNDVLIEKEGKYVSASQIEVNDVLYEITDIWGKNAYVIVYTHIVSGKITAILPNKVSPVSIEMDGKSYTLDESFPKEKLNASGVNQVGETAKIILGSDGTVVDIIADSVSGTENFAFVLNAYTKNSVKSADFGTPYYYVTLLHADGGKDTYLTKNSMSALRGKLATYEVTAKGTDYDTVSLRSIDTNATGSYRVNKEDRMLGDSYVANGAVLFNIKNTATAEIEASVISFGDLPSGTLINGKVKYIHKSGDFMDIDMMVLDDALDENTAYGLVTGKKTTGNMIGTEFVMNETVTLLVNGQTMTYTGLDTGVYINSPAKIRLNGNQVQSIVNAITSEAYAKEIEAVDSSRIRINGKVYTYHKNLSIYKVTGDSSWKKLEISDLTKGTENVTVTIYLDKPINYGGKVVMIILR